MGEKEVLNVTSKQSFLTFSEVGNKVPQSAGINRLITSVLHSSLIHLCNSTGFSHTPDLH